MQEVDAQTEEFLKEYPSWQTAGQAQLGKMYDPGDYPSVYNLRQRFSIDLEFEPIPRAEHFLLDMQQSTGDEIAAKAEKVVSKRMKEAQQSAWINLLDVTSHFAEVMSDPTKRFKASTIDNLIETLDFTPSLNFEGDPILNEVVNDIKQTMKGVDADTLRKNSAVRATVASASQAQVAEMTQIMDLAEAI